MENKIKTKEEFMNNLQDFEDYVISEYKKAIMENIMERIKAENEETWKRTDEK